MLQLMRDKAKSWVTFIVVGIIAFMMAITGLETLAPNPNNPEVASVNGKDITSAELARAVDQQRRMLQQQMGKQFDPSLLDEKQLQESVLKSLIERQLMLQDAEDHAMEVGTDALDKLIVSMPQFQQDGRFSQDRFQMMVRSYGMSAIQFRSMLREEILLQQLRSGIADSEFTTRKELERLNTLERQTRDLSWTVLAAEPVRAAITPGDDEIQAYYDAHQDRFMTPEQVVVEYVELYKSSIAKNIEVSEDEVRAEYELRIEELKEQNTNRVSSILVEEGSKRSAEEAKARAEEVVARLKGGADFAELAKEYSDDPVTASRGGDLGIVQPEFFDDAFNNAVAELKEGEFSGPVATQYGIQVLKLTEHRVQELPSLESLRAEIETSLKQSETDDLYLQQSQQLYDVSYEAADLSQPAEQFGLTIKVSEPFGRNGGEGLAADQRIVKEAFSEDVLELGRNSNLVEMTAPERAVVVRVKKHMEPELMPLSEVRSGIVASLKDQQAEQQLQQQANELTSKLNAGEQQEQLTWTESRKTPRNKPEVPAQILQKAFTMANPGDSTLYDTVSLPDGDLALIGLSAIYPGEAQAGDLERMKFMSYYISTDKGRNQFTDYLRSITERGDVEKKPLEE